MFLKPKSTVLNPPALLYRRFTNIQQSNNLTSVYKTIDDSLFWLFDSQNLSFTQIASDLLPNTSTIIDVTSTTILQFQTTFFQYVNSQWVSMEEPPENVTLLSATFNNIAKYQTNRYYFVGSFDYMIKGTIEGTTTQYIKGNIIPLTSMNIKYFDDSLHISVDDLVVIDKHLYSIENPEKMQKRLPKPFNIYFATLNSIL